MGSFSTLKFLFVVFLIASILQASMGGPYSCTPQECPSRCGSRCSETSYPKRCEQICMECCLTCLEVPPGTWGNKDLTPCCNSLRTKRGHPKCP